MHTFFPRCLSCSRPLPQAASGRAMSGASRVSRQRWHRGPGFRHKAALRQRLLAQQRDQQRAPSLGETRSPAAGGSPGASAGAPGTSAVTSSSVLAGIVSSAAPPTLSSHNVATATASHSRAARSGALMRVRCHCQPARLVILKPCSIQARRPYQPASLASGGRSVRISQGSL